MCDLCHEENDDEYEGESIAEKRMKASRSIINRHPELGLDPNEFTYRFAPKTEEECVRVNSNGQSPMYEIHVPMYMGAAMSRSPSLRGIAMAAWVETDKSYSELCNILDIGFSPGMERSFSPKSHP